MHVSTFSIVARDPRTGELGVAVASKFFAVGAVVPWVAADIGAVAVQSFVNGRFGKQALSLLRQGQSAQDCLKDLIETDAEPDGRQLGIVDARGQAAAFTGPGSLPWAGHRTGEGYAAQGNYLVGQETVDAMAAAFEANRHMDLPRRLLLALTAGQDAGGDKRGRQGAALVVHRTDGGYGGSDVVVDLRVDDHPEPVAELERLLASQHLYFGHSAPAERLAIDGAIDAELRKSLIRLGQLSPNADSAAFLASLRNVSLITNLDERVHIDKREIDPPALAYLTALEKL
ncbi:DUF1028 domain-containing protein [Dongia soli]|uniref:DUF1028 domain-containing protein n=1 Tax=Dongia soli TaxID=600628 RepID=A0ABU5EBB7_9PROT|nr:DUF1028 domain-containing protein [Dongia soli]MDY0883660.1 DUF1028 domain-containing protein [Dongia soli]